MTIWLGGGVYGVGGKVCNYLSHYLGNGKILSERDGGDVYTKAVKIFGRLDGYIRYEGWSKKELHTLWGAYRNRCVIISLTNPR